MISIEPKSPSRSSEIIVQFKLVSISFFLSNFKLHLPDLRHGMDWTTVGIFRLVFFGFPFSLAFCLWLNWISWSPCWRLWSWSGTAACVLVVVISNVLAQNLLHLLMVSAYHWCLYLPPTPDIATSPQRRATPIRSLLPGNPWFCVELPVPKTWSLALFSLWFFFSSTVPSFSWSVFLRAVIDHMICYNLNWPKIKLWVHYFVFSCALDHILKS